MTPRMVSAGLFLSVHLQAQRASAPGVPQGRVLGEGHARRLLPEGRDAGELRGEQPVAQPLAALLPHAVHGKQNVSRLDVKIKR